MRRSWTTPAGLLHRPGGAAGRPRPRLTPLAGPRHGQIAWRVGRLLVYVNDWDAFFLDAWREAADLADKAFGVVLPPPAYKPRTRS